MPDVHDQQTRSFNMSRVRSSGNRSTELRLLRLMRVARITGWRRHYPLLGKPDFVFPRLRLAVFVDGCFWHACPLGCKPLPKHNPFWRHKIAGNVARDREVAETLRSKGWKVLRIWEHDLASNERAVLTRIRRALARPLKRCLCR